MDVDVTAVTRRQVLRAAAVGVAATTSWSVLAQAPGASPSPESAARDAEKGRKKREERAAFFKALPIPRLKIEIPKEGMETLRGNPRQYVHAKLTEDNGGTVYEAVGVR